MFNAGASPIGLVELIVRDWDVFQRDPRAILPVMARHKALDEILEVLLDDLAEKFKAAEPEGEGGLPVMTLKDEGVSIGFRDTSGADVPKEMSKNIPRAISLFNAFTKGGLHRAMASCNQDEINKVLEQGMYALIDALFRLNYRKTVDAANLGPDQMHWVPPYFEVYSPTFRTGVEAIAHINALYAQDNQVIMELAEICGGQHHMILAAAEPLRTGATELSPLALRALTLLRKQVHLLPDATRVIDELRKLNLSNFPKEGEQDAEKEKQKMAQEQIRQFLQLAKQLRRTAPETQSAG
jgi:hypothetical protein